MSNVVPAINIQKKCYTMASVDGETAEITMYGDIYEQEPTNWWGEPIEGQFILLTDFMKDLEQIMNCKEITIRINSYGGDAGVSNLIHNRLREISRGGAKLTCIVDGVAMSGGSLIMCACDAVKVNPSSLIMIHKCWSFFWGGYNADELREAATQQDAWDKMQQEIYKRKTNLPDSEIVRMMAETTYMTGREAVEKGFADELMEDAEPLNIAASASGQTLFVRGHEIHLAPGIFAPDKIPTVNPGASASVETNKTKTPVGPASKEGGKLMAKTVQELRTEYPELTAQFEAEIKDSVCAEADNAMKAERARLQEIDEIANLFDASLVHEAKYGEKVCNAQELALRAAKDAAANSKRFMTAMQEDADASGSASVGVAPSPAAVENNSENMTFEQRMEKARGEVASLLRKKGE